MLKVRHFIDGKDFVTQALYCDSGNAQEIRRTVIDNGNVLLVINTVTKKEKGEVVAAAKYYSRLVASN